MNFKNRLSIFLIELSHRIKGYLYTRKWYSNEKITFNKTAVFVCDGRLDSCGMTDRFVGIVSLYCWAKQHGIPFRIQYTYPFKLFLFLLPNKYDWLPKVGDYVEDRKAARIVYAIGEPGVLSRLNSLKDDKQIHFYGDRNLLPSLGIPPENWGAEFLELFKPSDALSYKISALKKDFGDYFSVCFRFQNLLGDFSEYGFKSIQNKEDLNELVMRCISLLAKLMKSHNGLNCVITSDSVNFLKIASKETGCLYIKGNLVHMGSNPNGKIEEYEKSFLDFFILSESRKIYNVVIGDMYPSSFPYYAAKLHGIPFERISIE